MMNIRVLLYHIKHAKKSQGQWRKINSVYEVEALELNNSVDNDLLDEVNVSESCREKNHGDMTKSRDR